MPLDDLQLLDRIERQMLVRIDLRPMFERRLADDHSAARTRRTDHPLHRLDKAAERETAAEAEHHVVSPGPDLEAIRRSFDEIEPAACG